MAYDTEMVRRALEDLTNHWEQILSDLKTRDATERNSRDDELLGFQYWAEGLLGREQSTPRD